MKDIAIYVVLELLCLSVFCISFSSSMTSDGISLLALKAGVVIDPNHALISWSDSDPTPCKWAGISCDSSRQKVISISLSGKNLAGYIASEIGALSSLALLDLSNNSFSGPLPHQLTALQNLAHFDVSSNNFNGSLPEDLSNLTHLAGTLNLSYNAFSGEVPADFGLFPVMVSLDLRHNNLTGKIPQVGSLLNQGPTAFSGNPNLCGFPLSTPCAAPEAQNPRFSSIPQKPENAGISSAGFAQNRKVKSGLLSISVISGALLVAFVAVWGIRRKWKETAAVAVEAEEGKVGRETASAAAAAEGQKGKFVVVDEGFGLELEDLLRASAYVLGKSKSGIVYKVVTGAGCAPAAVRRLSEGEGDATWRQRDFEAEVEAIGRVKHPNIVRLKAYYYAIDEKLLISEFIRNGSLHSALHGPVNKLPPLSWASRQRIIQGAAKGLMHIHECSHKKYVHGNVRSSKILLDSELKPYISGFGLSRLVPSTSRKSQATPNPQTSNSSYTMYVAPESQESVKLTQKGDVYAFGIVILEILTGKLPDDDEGQSDGKGLEGLVRKAFKEGRPLSEIIDPALLPEVRAKKQVLAVFHIALSCTEMDPELRPKMRTVCDNLDNIKLQ